MRLRIVHGSNRATTPALEAVLDPGTAEQAVMLGRTVGEWRRALTGWDRGNRVAEEELDRNDAEARGPRGATGRGAKAGAAQMAGARGTERQ